MYLVPSLSPTLPLPVLNHCHGSLPVPSLPHWLLEACIPGSLFKWKDTLPSCGPCVIYALLLGLQGSVSWAPLWTRLPVEDLGSAFQGPSSAQGCPDTTAPWRTLLLSSGEEVNPGQFTEKLQAAGQPLKWTVK